VLLDNVTLPVIWQRS